MGKTILIIVSLVLLIAVLLSNAAIFSRCTGEGVEVKKVSIEESDELAAKVDPSLVGANTEFGFNIFKGLTLEDKDTNIFISPLSMLLALAMAYNGAVGETNLAMGDALEFSGLDLEELNSGFSDLIIAIENADSDIDMAIANSIWYKKGFEPEEDFIERNEKYYASEIKELDFSKADAVDIINGWISDATRKKIEKMLSEIPPDVIMYLINAIYFKGNWTYEFDESLTIDEDFNLLDGSSKKVPMMVQRGNFKYFEGDDFSSVRLPYGQDKMAMYMVLPDSGVEVDTTIESFDQDSWNEATRSFSEAEVNIHMPRFKMEYGIKLLNTVLEDLGMEIAFGPAADFSGIAPGIFISRVLHKAVIEVNEKGSEAAAVTVVEMVESAMPEVKTAEFIVDRPFFFIIADDRSGSILFMGKVIEP